MPVVWAEEYLSGAKTNICHTAVNVHKPSVKTL